MCKYIDLTVEALFRNIIFLMGRALLNSITDIHCSAAEGKADQNLMTVAVEERAIEIFHFAEVIKG